MQTSKTTKKPAQNQNPADIAANEALGRRSSRRGMFALGAVAGAGALAAALLPDEASAHGTHYDGNTSDPTLHITNSADGPGLLVNANSGPAIKAFSSSPNEPAVVGGWIGSPSSASPHSGVYGSTHGNAPAVHGHGPNVGVRGSARTVDPAYTLTGGTGVSGESGSGAGVNGRSQSGAGVFGASETANGVHGRSLAEGGAVSGISVANAGLLTGALDATNPANLGNGPGVRGTSGGGSGVTGQSQSASGVLGRTHDTTAPYSAGVSGFALLPAVSGPPPYSDADLGPAIGVQGRGKGAGVQGSAPGEAPGVRALSSSASGAPDNGLALQVIGKTSFSTAGTVTIPAGNQDLTVANPAVQATSIVLASFLGDPGATGPALRWVERQAGIGFVLHLTKKVLAPILVGYFVID